MAFVDVAVQWNRVESPARELFVIVLATTVAILVGLLPYIDNFTNVGALVMGVLSSLVLVRMPFSTKTMILKILGGILSFLALFVAFLAFYFTNGTNNWCSFCKKIDCLPILGWCETMDL